MGNQVYANGREISCKAADGKSVCAFPDVCLSPPSPPAGPIPIPYPNTGMASDCSGGSMSVKISGEEVMLKDKSFFKKSTGDEAATKGLGMGVITHQIQGKVYFTAWSMDVKFEGENVVRHLDLTTHNHASSPGQTPPWPYADAAAIGPGGACEAEQEPLKGSCAQPVDQDTSPGCCAVPQRQCVLIPKNKDKSACCPNHGTTGHHVIPKQELCVEGSSGDPLPGNPNYNHLAAPCLCVEGGNPSKRDDSGNLMSHALFHNAYKQGRNAHLATQGPWTYQGAKRVAAEAAAKESPCSPRCLEHQIAQYHDSRVTEVRVSEQKSFDPTPRPPVKKLKVRN